jgi:hypothetical protein
MRNARFSDIPALATMLKESHLQSKYAARCGVSDKAIEQALTSCVATMNQNGPGASFVKVIERDEKIVAFMAGTLSRIYGIGTKLSASDLFLVSNGKSIKDVLALIDEYISWANSNPKVIEVGLSWSDALPNGEAIANIYKRKGARLVGEQYSIELDLATAEAA